MFHVTFEGRHQMKRGDYLIDEQLRGLVAEFVEHVHDGTMATGMAHVFSRAGAL